MPGKIETSENAETSLGSKIVLDGHPQHQIDWLFSLEGAEFVESCYRVFLGRASDRSGFELHLARLIEDGDKEGIARGIYGSAEALVYREARPSIVESGQAEPMVVVRRGALDGAGRVRPEPGEPAIWVDLTTALEWTGGVVGIVRTELELAAGLKKLYPSVRFSMQVRDGFGEIPESELQWLLSSDNAADAYMRFFGRYKNEPSTPGSVDVFFDDSRVTRAPFESGDIIFSCGWMDSKKELYFSRIRKKMKIYLSYLIYDTILLNKETKHFYHPSAFDKFKSYLKWVSYNCDFLLFGGETAKSDVERVQRSHGWPVLPGKAVQFGTDIVKSVDDSTIPDMLSRLGVREPFLITVGSLEPRKNHETLYRAYLLALERAKGPLPQLVFVGKPLSRVEDLVDSLKRDPRLEGKLLLRTPSDIELAALYSRCLFTLLPSVYEGWSLTLPESLAQGKFCLTADTPPLREIGGGLVDYIAPYDVSAWADAILRYSGSPELLAEKEAEISRNWPETRWIDTAGVVKDALLGLYADTHRAGPGSPATRAVAPTIWMDLTLTYLQWSGGLNGIVRAELTLAHHLKKLAPETRFFAYDDGRFFEIDEELLRWLIDASDLSKAYNEFQGFWNVHESAGAAFRSPFRQRGTSLLDEREIFVFPANSIVFFAAIDMDGTGKLHRNKDVLRLASQTEDVIFCQLVYDFTPIILPHLHLKSTCVGYPPFIDFVMENFDYLIYGGRTAQRDGLAYAGRNQLRHPKSDPIEFGSDLNLSGNQTATEVEDRRILERLGIRDTFLLTVGTIEPRKNHEVLYKAFLHLIDADLANEPVQLVFAGKPGWKSDNLLDAIKYDERVKDKILMIQPTDPELDVLYRHCRFTLLPSFYEGWSLTLPESLSYGKFCLVSDVEPLRETGGELVEYIHPLDTYRWAARIAHYINHPELVTERERSIKNGWRPMSWRDSTAHLIGLLGRAHEDLASRRRPGSFVA